MTFHAVLPSLCCFNCFNLIRISSTTLLLFASGTAGAAFEICMKQKTPKSKHTTISILVIIFFLLFQLQPKSNRDNFFFTTSLWLLFRDPLDNLLNYRLSLQHQTVSSYIGENFYHRRKFQIFLSLSRTFSACCVSVESFLSRWWRIDTSSSFTSCFHS